MQNNMEFHEQRNLILLALSTGVTGGVLYSFIKKFQKGLQEKQEIKDMRVYRPDEIKQKMLNNDLGLGEKFKKIDNDTVKTENVLLQGLVQCDQPLHSLIKHNQVSLVYRASANVKRYSNQFLFPQSLIVPDSKDDIIRYMDRNQKKFHWQQKDKFNIQDPEKQRILCNVPIEKDTVILNSSLSFAQSWKRSKELSVQKKILQGFMLLPQLVLYPFNIVFGKQPFIKGIQVAEEKHELGIECGKVLTVLGDIVYNFKTNELRLENPIYFMRDRRSIMLYLQKKIDKIFIKTFVSGAVFTVFSAILIYKLQYLYKKYKVTKRKGRYQNMKNLEEMGNNVPEDMKCLLCTERPRSIILKPCLHTYMCKQCLRNVQLQNNICSICRTGIEGVAEILIENDIQKEQNNNDQIDVNL